MYNGTNKLYEEELRKDKCRSLYNDLKRYEEQGIRIRVRGNSFPIKKCAEIMSINENECYMPDMLEDDYGKVVEINYDFVAHI